jgi:Holliday junction resolvase
MAKQKPETAVLSGIRDWLRLYGWYVIRIHQGLGCHKGLSDLIAIKKGVVLFIEVKLPDNPRSVQSEHQVQFEQCIKNRGGHYLVARCWQAVDEYIKLNCPDAL